MRFDWAVVLISINLCFFGLVQAQDLLQENDVHRIMQQILSEHVDKHEMTGKIIQNSIDVYIEQFDPHYIYLLEREITPFIRLSPEELNQIIKQYKNGQFSVYQQLNEVISQSILRARKIRSSIENETVNDLFHFNLDKEPAIHSQEPDHYARTETELKQHIVENMRDFIEKQKNRFGSSMTSQKKQQILHLYEVKLREFENQYLYQNDKGEALPLPEKQNLFSIHLLKALAKSLDSHTSFYQDKEAYELRVKLQKEFKGIGLVLKESNQGAIVTSMLENGPAANSGLIKVGDILLEINGESVADMSFDQIMNKLHEDKNTEVKITLKHLGDKGEKERIYTVELKRVMILLNNDRVDVSNERFGNGILGKIVLHSFYQGEGISSEKDVKNGIEKLKKEGNLRGLILDLRDNSGGFLSQAVKVAGLFITNGVIVISKYSNGDERIYRDVDSSVTYDGPLIVLTSKATASAAEIVAQALQDYGVALIVGDERTYGKGTIQAQTVTDNLSSSYFKVTVGKYYTVSGRTPQKTGVIADIVVPGHWSQEELGEIYMDSVQPDTILPTFQDSLKDIGSNDKSWFLKYYTPHLQQKRSTWRPLLKTLQKNSEYRISHNKNYQFFLKGTISPDENLEEDEWEETDNKRKRTYGEDDLQMQEAVNILKDMILLHDLEGNEKEISVKH